MTSNENACIVMCLCVCVSVPSFRLGKHKEEAKLLDEMNNKKHGIGTTMLSLKMRRHRPEPVKAPESRSQPFWKRQKPKNSRKVDEPKARKTTKKEENHIVFTNPLDEESPSPRGSLE